MKTAFFSIALAVALGGCGREQPPVNQARIDETRQVEKAADQAKPLTDSSLTQIVRTALQSESSLDARRIDVENRDGVVALHGRVETEEQKEKAGRIVGSVGGVKTVDNRLTVDDTASTGATAGGPDLPKPTELPK
jgi:osmotically-inducible protein OsmY